MLEKELFMTTPYTLGSFTNGPDTGGYAAGQEAFESLMGAKATMVNVYMDFTQPALPNTGSASYVASSFNASGLNANVIPLIGMTLSSSAVSTATNADFLEALANTTQYDSAIEGMVTGWKNAGYKTLYWRPVVEMNLTSTPGFAAWENNQGILVAALQKAYTLIHAASTAQGVTSLVIWNPGCSNSSPAGLATETLYPGDAYCDAIGGDIYDNLYPMSGTVAEIEASPALLEAYYNNPSEGGSNASDLSADVLMSFALAHGKPFCLPETGCGANPSDNGTFPAWLRSKVDSYVAKGMKFLFLSIWDSNAGGNYCFSDGSKPNEAAAWVANWGVNAPAAPGETPVVTPTPHAASPANTQVNGTTGTIYDTAGNAWTITAAQTIAMNGTPVPISANVVTLFWTGSALDQLNSEGQWWTQPLSGGEGVEITAPTGYKPPVVPPIVISTTQLPQTEFVIYLAADEYLGNAQCTIAVDGKVVAAGLPVVALKASNQEQGFSWYGSYGVGSHTVTVQFTNDDYGGTAATDRNLYFCSLTVDGTSYGTSTELPSNGDTATITVTTKY
jgi:hypothetical protein